MTKSLTKPEDVTYASSKNQEENTGALKETKPNPRGPRGPRGTYASWINDRNSEDKSSLDIIVDWLKEEANYSRYMYELTVRQEFITFNDIIDLLVSTGHVRREIGGVQHQIKYLQIKYRMVINEFQEIATFDFDEDYKITSTSRNGKRHRLSDLIRKKFKHFYILRPAFLKWELAHPESALTESQNNEPAPTEDLGNKRPRENSEDEKNIQNFSKKQPRVIAEEDEEEEDEEEEKEFEEEEFENNKNSFWNWTWNKQTKDHGENETNLLSIPPNSIEEEDKEEEEKKVEGNESGENENEIEIRIQRNEEQHIDQSNTKKPNNVKSLPSPNAQLNNNNTDNVEDHGNRNDNYTNDKHEHNIISASNKNHSNDGSRRKSKKKKKKFSAVDVINQKVQKNTRKLALEERKVALAERIVALEEKKFELKKKSLDLKEKGILLIEEANEQKRKKKKKSLFGSLFEWF